MVVIDAAVRKAFDALGELPTAAARKAHIEFLQDKFAHAERDILKLEKENLGLLRENKDVKERLSKAEQRLADLTFQTILADIGPCKVKVDVNRQVLPGYYCPKCGLQLHRGEYTPWGKDALICQACPHVRLQGADADAAKGDFVQRILHSQEISS